MGLIEEGARAPMFTLSDQGGEEWGLKSALSEGPGVVYFYPKDDTSGCTKEACAFRDALPAFEGLGAWVVGVSPQGVESKAKFAGKHGLRFPLLADEGSKVCEKYGVWQEKSMYGRSYMGVVRTTYVIGRDGKVLKRFDRVKVPGHAEAVLGVLSDESA